MSVALLSQFHACVTIQALVASTFIFYCGRGMMLFNLAIVLAKQKKREKTSKLKILRIKKWEYGDGIKSKETRPGWGEAHNVCKACAYRYHGGANMCT